MQQYTPLVSWDWVVIAAFFIITLGIGLYFSKRGTGSMTEYFVAGRKMTWWLAGTSIVATSFAADTPLVIAGFMRTSGLEKNWFWWGGIMGMMLCTFFFARLWRRANILTDVEFNEIRYEGKPAAGLRIFHASYRSLIQNTIVMGWVTLAMTKILEVTLNIPTLVFVHGQILPELVAKGVDVYSVIDAASVVQWPLLGAAIVPAKITGIVACMGVAAIYSAISGLWGVMATDFFQFCFAMTGTIVLMVISLVVAGGPTRMVMDAKQAVAEGIVINRTPSSRAAVPPVTTGERAAALEQAGLAGKDAEGRLVWSAAGLSESDVAARIEAALPGKAASLLPLWRAAYTISPGSFTDSSAVQRMLDAGILIADAPARTAPYYRLPDVSLSEGELQQRLAAAGVADRSEIMAAWRGDQVVTPRKITNFLPPFDLKGGGLLAIWSLVVFLGLQWWAGGEGGGFLAQRLFSCKNEKHSVLAMLWFNFANYVLRPWPWIVVGVASLFLVPDVTVYGAGYDQEHVYVVMLMKYLPVGLKGMMVAALMAAYMSTISTHVNFGASYVVNDLYKRFVNRKGTERGDVLVSQIASILLAVLAAVYAYFATTIASGWFTLFELMSGAGFVILLRWYWWRISAWSEIAAMFSSLVMFALLNWTTVFHALFRLIGAPVYLLDEYAVRFTINLVCSTAMWVAVTFLTPPESEAQLIRFYQRIRPAGWWRRVAAAAGNPNHMNVGWVEWSCWGLGVTGLFSMIASVGKACFGSYLQSFLYGIYGVIATILIFRLMKRMDWSAMASTDEGT